MFLNRLIKTLIFILVYCLSCFVGIAQYANENDLKKQALKFFEDEDYANAYKAYSTLVSTYPKDPNYNYHLGVCMLYNEKDKKKCFPYLELANKKIEECDKEAKFYLAKANHINFRFDEAIRLYIQYKDIASSSMIKKLNVDMEIQACKNGKKLLGNLSELVVLEKKQLNESDYFRSYNLSDIGGKLLVKPADFISANDKKKKNKSIIYLPKSNDKLFYSSYGENDNKDLYIVKRLPNGEWSKPQDIGMPINTSYDEDYPFLHPNGKVLYFASKGHNSMGGYDIFKSEWNENSKKWGEPKNLEFPINTPNDDILFVTDSLEKTAYFSSSRYSPTGKIDVYKIDVERRPPEYIYISGSMLKKSPDQSLESKITVKSIGDEPYNEAFQASKAGAYLIKIPNGGKFIFTFETPGFPTQSEDIDVPLNNYLTTYSQVAGYRENILYVQNFFETNPEDENSYIQNLEVIEKKSQLEVNANEFTRPAIDSSYYENSAKNDGQKGKRLKGTTFENQPTETNSTSKSTNNQTENSTSDAKKDINNNELEKMAFEDAKELEQEAKKIKDDADQAFEFLDNKKFEASQKNKEAIAVKDAAANETDLNKREELLKKSDELSEEAKKLDEQSKLAENIARQLENESVNKKNEAELQKNYAEQLKQVNSSKNSSEALKKLEEVQKKIEDFEKNKKTSVSVADQLKSDIARKDEEISKIDSKANKLQTELNNLNNELKSLDQELEETKDKDLKANIVAQKEELQGDIKAKQDELKTEKDKIAFINNEKEVLKNQSAFADNMLSEMKNLPANEKQDKSSSDLTQKTVNNASETKSDDESNTFKIADANQSKTNVSENSDLQTIGDNKSSAIEDEELKELVTQNEIPTKINQLINVDFKNPEAIKFKQEAQKSFKRAENEKNQTEKHINNIAKNTGSSDADNNAIAENKSNVSNTNSSASTDKINLTEEEKKKINMEIDKLYMEALTLRRAAFEMTGDEKTKQFAEAKAKDKLAAEKRLDLALKVAKINEEKYNENEQLLKQYQNQTANQTDPEIIQATNLITEADKLYKQAMKIEEDAVLETDPAAKSSSYSNVEEKEVEALQKQEAAIAIYKKKNPDFTPVAQVEKTDVEANSVNRDEEIEVVKSEIEQKNKDVKESLSQLANAYEKEVSSLMAKSKSPDLSKIKKQKQKADSLFAVSIFAGSDDEKIQQLLRVNDIYNKALTQLNQPASIPLAKNNTNKTEQAATPKNDATKSTETNQVAKTSEPKSENTNKTNLAETQKKNTEANQTAKTSDSKTDNTNSAVAKSNTNSTSTSDQNKSKISSTDSTTNVVKTNIANDNIVKTPAQKTETNSVAEKDKKTPDTGTTEQIVSNTPENKNDTQLNNDNISAEDAIAKNTEENQSTNNTENVDAKKDNTNDELNSDKVNSTKLTEQEEKELRQSTEFVTYTNLNKALKKYDDLTASENQLAKDLLEQSQQYLRESEQLQKNSSTIENSDEKKIQLARSNELKNLATEMKLKADSVNELAQNTKAFTESKRMEYEAFTEGLEKDLLVKIKTIDQKDKVAKSNSANNSGNASIENSDQLSANNIQYSESYINKINALEKEFERLEAKGKPDATIEEFEKRNLVINKMIEIINQETNHLNAISTSLSANQQNDNTSLISQLVNKKNSLENKIADNLTSIKNIKEKDIASNISVKSTDGVAIKQNNNVNQSENLTSDNTKNTAQNNSSGAVNKNDSANSAADKSINSAENNSTITTNKTSSENENLVNQKSKTTNDQSNALNSDKTSSSSVKTVVIENNKNSTATAGTTNDDNAKVVSANNNKTQIKENSSSINSSSSTNSENKALSATSLKSTENNSASGIKGRGFEVLTEEAYSEIKPIPVDVKLPNGIIFAVQIGAFRNPIPNNLFKGLTPLRGETTNKGLIRYQAGKFEQFEDANGVKNDLKKMGYRDAFVVVYKDGNLITLPEAIAELKSKGINIKQDENQTAGITNSVNIPPATEIVSKMNEVAVNNGNFKSPDELRGNNNEAFVVSTDVNTVQGLFYTVQVGLFSSNVSSSKLYNLTPLFTDKIQSSTYRYTAGIYTSLDKVKTDRLKVVDLGIKDAFVSAYLNGQRIKISEATSKINAGEKIIFPNEQPIRFSSANLSNNNPTLVQNQNQSDNTSIVNENNSSNNLTTLSNSEKGVVYKIQIGAFRKQANKEARTKFSKIKDLTIDTKQINELYVYSAGSFLDMNSARPALETVKQLGIQDAFICVYRDGKKLYGEEAAKLMGRR
jgi:hypothetical protein